MLIIETRRGSRGKLWIKRGAFLGVAALIAGCWLAYQPALARYHQWKQARALRQAKEFIAKHDAADAQLALEVALIGTPAGIETWRTAADMMDQVGAPQALRMRQHVMEMMGATLEDRVALVNTALRLRDFNAARDALGDMSRKDADKPMALGAALSFAIETNDRPVADALFDRLRAAAPDNDDFKVAQAMLHLRHPNPQVAAAARQELADWTKNPKYSLRVQRSLLADATMRKDYPGAERWAAQLVANLQSNLDDKLNQADLQLLVDKQSFGVVFGRLSALAQSNPTDAAEFARWVMIQGKVKESDAWMAGLSPALQNSPPVMTARAEAAAQQQDWDRLSSLLIAGAWGPVSADSVKLAMSARLISSHGGPTLRRQIWDEALQSAGGNLGSLVVLQRVASFWKWVPEAEATLWTIARQFPDQTWVDQALYNTYRTRRDTANMRDVMNLLRNNDPGILRYQHDWALLSLLSNPTSSWDQPKRILERLYHEKPDNAFYATSYAFALAQSGKAKEALAVISKLSQLDLDFSPRQPYLAYIYGLNKERVEVERAQSKAMGAAFLPEETELFLKAREDMDRREPPPAKLTQHKLLPAS